MPGNGAQHSAFQRLVSLVVIRESPMRPHYDAPKNSCIQPAYRIFSKESSERSSAWLEHLVWDQDVAGSNPVAPTIYFHGVSRISIAQTLILFRAAFLIGPQSDAAQNNPAAGDRLG